MVIAAEKAPNSKAAHKGPKGPQGPRAEQAPVAEKLISHQEQAAIRKELAELVRTIEQNKSGEQGEAQDKASFQLARQLAHLKRAGLKLSLKDMERVSPLLAGQVERFRQPGRAKQLAQMHTYLKYAEINAPLTEQDKKMILGDIGARSSNGNTADLSARCMYAKYLGVKENFADVQPALAADTTRKNDATRQAFELARRKFIGVAYTDKAASQAKAPDIMNKTLADAGITDRLELLQKKDKWGEYAHLRVAVDYLRGQREPANATTDQGLQAGRDQHAEGAAKRGVWQSFTTYIGDLRSLKGPIENTGIADLESLDMPDAGGLGPEHVLGEEHDPGMLDTQNLAGQTIPIPRPTPVPAAEENPTAADFKLVGPRGLSAEERARIQAIAKRRASAGDRYDAEQVARRAERGKQRTTPPKEVSSDVFRDIPEAPAQSLFGRIKGWFSRKSLERSSNAGIDLTNNPEIAMLHPEFQGLTQEEIDAKVAGWIQEGYQPRAIAEYLRKDFDNVPPDVAAKIEKDKFDDQVLAWLKEAEPVNEDEPEFSADAPFESSISDRDLLQKASEKGIDVTKLHSLTKEQINEKVAGWLNKAPQASTADKASGVLEGSSFNDREALNRMAEAGTTANDLAGLTKEEVNERVAAWIQEGQPPQKIARALQGSLAAAAEAGIDLGNIPADIAATIERNEFDKKVLAWLQEPGQPVSVAESATGDAANFRNPEALRRIGEAGVDVEYGPELRNLSEEEIDARIQEWLNNSDITSSDVRYALSQNIRMTADAGIDLENLPGAQDAVKTVPGPQAKPERWIRYAVAMLSKTRQGERSYLTIIKEAKREKQEYDEWTVQYPGVVEQLRAMKIDPKQAWQLVNPK